MKSLKSFFILCILLFNFQLIYAQKKDENFVLFDSVAEANYEDLAVRIDYLASETNKISGAVGYVVIYDRKNPIENAFYKRAIKNYLRFRNFDEKRFFVITSTNSEKCGFEFWTSKNGSKLDIDENDFSLKLPTDKAVNFIDDLIEIVNIDGKATFFPAGCDAGCIQQIDLFLLSEFIVANPQLKAFIIIRDKNLKKAKQIMNILFKESSEMKTITMNKINFLYGSMKKQRENNFSEISIYLAVNQSYLPKNAQNYKSIY